MPTAITPGIPVNSPPAPAPTAPDNGLGKDAFLKLLVAQLRYQDPMNPAEGADFMAQTAQFTMVEKLEELSASQRESGAAALIGRQVTYLNSVGEPATGLVTGFRATPAGPLMRVGDDEVLYNAIAEVSQAPTS